MSIEWLVVCTGDHVAEGRRKFAASISILESTTLHITTWRKENSQFDLQFVLNAHHFTIIVMYKANK